MWILALLWLSIVGGEENIYNSFNLDLSGDKHSTQRAQGFSLTTEEFGIRSSSSSIADLSESLGLMEEKDGSMLKIDEHDIQESTSLRWSSASQKRSNTGSGEDLFRKEKPDPPDISPEAEKNNPMELSENSAQDYKDTQMYLDSNELRSTIYTYKHLIKFPKKLNNSEFSIAKTNSPVDFLPHNNYTNTDSEYASKTYPSDYHGSSNTSESFDEFDESSHVPYQSFERHASTELDSGTMVQSEADESHKLSLSPILPYRKFHDDFFLKLTPLEINATFPRTKGFEAIEVGYGTLLTLTGIDGRTYLYSLDQSFKVEFLKSLQSEGQCSFILIANSPLLCCPFTVNGDRVLQLFAIEQNKTRFDFNLVNQLKGCRLLDYWTLNNTTYILVSESAGKDKLDSFKVKLYGWNEKTLEVGDFLDGDYSDIARFSDDKGDYLVTLSVDGSEASKQTLELYSHLPPQRKRKLLQSIPSDGIYHLTYFGFKTLGNFLLTYKKCQGACLGETKVTIYKIYEGEMIFYQSLPASSAQLQWIPYMMNQTPVLAVIDFFDGIDFYAYDGGKFVLIEPLDALSKPGLTRMQSITRGQQHFFGLSSVNSDTNGLMFYEIDLKETLTRKDMENLIRKWTKSTMDKLEEKWATVSNELASAPIKDSSYNVEHKLTFQNNLTILNDHVVIPVTDKESEKMILNKVKIYSKDVQALTSELGQLYRKASQCLNFQSVTSWTGLYEMSTVVINDGIVQNLYANLIDNVEVPSEKDLISIKDNGKMLNITSMFFDNVQMKGVVVKEINSKPIESYVTLNGNHVITSRMKVRNLKAHTMSVGGLIDGIKIDSKSLLLSEGDQRIRGNLYCHSASMKNLRTKYINDFNLAQLFGTAAYNKGTIHLKNLHIRGDLTFPGNLVVRRILGQNADDLLNNILLSNSSKEQIIYGDLTLARASLQDVHLANSLNKIRFSDSVFINSPKMNYLIDKALFNDIYAKEVLIQHSLNEIQVNDGQLDIMTIKGDQIITGQKNFYSLHIDNKHSKPLPSHIDVQGPTLLKKLKEISQTIDASKNSFKLFAELNQKDKILNRISIIWALISNIFGENDLLERENKTHFDQHDREFTKEGQMDSVFSQLEDHFLSKAKLDYDQLLQELIAIYRAFRDHLTRIGRNPLEIQRAKDFNEKVHGKLEKFGRVMRAKIARLAEIRAGMGQVDSVLQRAKSELEFLFYGPTHVYGLVSGYNLSEIPRFSSSKYEEFTLSKILNAQAIIFNKDLKAESINGINVDRLFTHALKLNEREMLNKFVFTNKVQILGNLKTEKLNDVRMKEYATTSGINMFQNMVTFKQPIRVTGNVLIKGTVNGYKLSSEAQRIAVANGNQTILYPVAFKLVECPEISSSDVKIKGVPLQDFVLRDENAVISGRKSFKKLIFNGDVLVNNLEAATINGIDLSSINRFNRTVAGPVYMKGPANVTSATILGNLNVLKNLRGEKPISKNLTRLMNEVVMLDGEHNNLGKVAFAGKVFVKNLLFSDTFDGVKAETFEKGWLLKDGERTVRAKTFFKSLKANNVNIASNRLQGVDLLRLKTKTAKINEDATFHGEVFFKKFDSLVGIEVKGLVQGQNLTRDAILNRGSVLIPSKKSFQSVYLKGEIDALGTINRMNLRKVCASAIGTLTVEGSLHVEGGIFVEKIKSGDQYFPMEPDDFWLVDQEVNLQNVVFLNDVQSRHTFIEDYINGIPIEKVTRNNRMDCNVIKHGDMKVNKIYADEIDSTIIEAQEINGYNLKFLSRILQHSDQKFSDPSFFSNLTISGLDLSGSLNNISVASFCLKSKPCEITARKHFLGDLNVEDAVIIDENGKINGSPWGLKDYGTGNLKIFVKGSLKAPSLQVDGLVNGINFDKDHVMTTYGDQFMTEDLLITNDVNEGYAVKAQEIFSPSHLYNKYNLTDLYLFQNGTSMSQEDNFSIEHLGLLQSYRALKENSMLVAALLADQAISFNGWEAINTLGSNIHRITPILSEWITSESLSSSVAIISDDGIAIWNYSPTSKAYKDSGITIAVPGNCATDVKGFYKGNLLFIATSANCRGMQVPNEDLIMHTDNDLKNHNEFSYIWLHDLSGIRMVAALSTASARQVLSLEIGQSGCFMFINEGSPNQIILCEKNGKFIIKQSFKVGFSFQALNLNLAGTKYLILGSYLQNGYSSSKATIFKYNERDEKYENTQEIGMERLSHISGGEFKGNLFVALIQQPFFGTRNGIIKVFRLKDFSTPSSSMKPVFELEQKISIDSPVQVSFLQLPSNEFLLLILNEARVIHRFVKRGIEKFQKEGSLFVEGATSIETWIVKNRKAHLLAITVQERTSGREKRTASRILKASFKGLSL